MSKCDLWGWKGGGEGGKGDSGVLEGEEKQGTEIGGEKKRRRKEKREDGVEEGGEC